MRPKLTEFQEELWQTKKRHVRIRFAVVLLSLMANTAVLHARAPAIRLRLIATADIPSAPEISKQLKSISS